MGKVIPIVPGLKIYPPAQPRRERAPLFSRPNFRRHGLPVGAALLAAAAAFAIPNIHVSQETPKPGCGVGIMLEGDGPQRVVEHAANDAHIAGGVSNEVDAGNIVASMEPDLQPGERFYMEFSGNWVRIDTIREVGVMVNHCADLQPPATMPAPHFS
jgi:hypothetical protein